MGDQLNGFFKEVTYPTLEMNSLCAEQVMFPSDLYVLQNGYNENMETFD